MQKLTKITVPELRAVEHAHLTEGMRTTVMTDDEFWSFFKEVCDIADKFDYELLEDGLINIYAIEDHYLRG